MTGALVSLGYAVALGLLVAAAFRLFRLLLQPTRDLRAGRFTTSATALLVTCIVFTVIAIAAALIGAHAAGISIIDLMLLRRVGSLDAASWRRLWPEEIVFTIYVAGVIALVNWAFFRER